VTGNILNYSGYRAFTAESWESVLWSDEVCESKENH
jgi:hypothetical protein